MNNQQIVGIFFLLGWVTLFYAISTTETKRSIVSTLFAVVMFILVLIFWS